MRASRYTVVESRLTKAVMENKITDPKVERAITQGLAAGNIESALLFKVLQLFLTAFIPRGLLGKGWSKRPDQDGDHQGGRETVPHRIYPGGRETVCCGSQYGRADPALP